MRTYKGSADTNLEQDPIKTLSGFWSAETCARPQSLYPSSAFSKKFLLLGLTWIVVLSKPNKRYCNWIWS